MMRFHDAVDRALSESVAQYQRLVDQSQNMFLAILGHDLRNPLGTLVAGANLMMNDLDLAPKHVMMATRMFSSARRMKKLIDDFIDFTRTHLGTGIPVKIKPGNLVAVCWQVVSELRTAYPKRFVDLRTPPKLEATFDADRIEQIFDAMVRLASNIDSQPSERTSLGIGLYISREIIRAHAGEIGVVSNAEHGTTFTVTMPRYQ